VAYERHNVMVDVNYLARKLYLVANKRLVPRQAPATRNRRRNRARDLAALIQYDTDTTSLGNTLQQ